eukprot:3122838-Rhodomonas_salina.6
MEWDNEKIRELMEDKKEADVKKNGGVEGIALKLGSSIKEGISSSSLETRKEKYGPNEIERRKPATFIQLFIDAMKDVVIMILIVAAVVSIVLGGIMCAVHLGEQCPKRLIWQNDPIDLTKVPLLSQTSTLSNVCLHALLSPPCTAHFSNIFHI